MEFHFVEPFKFKRVNYDLFPEVNAVIKGVAMAKVNAQEMKTCSKCGHAAYYHGSPTGCAVLEDNKFCNCTVYKWDIINPPEEAMTAPIGPIDGDKLVYQLKQPNYNKLNLVADLISGRFSLPSPSPELKESQAFCSQQTRGTLSLIADNGKLENEVKALKAEVLKWKSECADETKKALEALAEVAELKNLRNIESEHYRDHGPARF